MPAHRQMKYDFAAELYQRCNLTVRQLAEFYGVSHQAMWDALRRRIALNPRDRPGKDNPFYRGGKTAFKRTQSATERAIKKGLLVPQPCEVCGAQGRMHAHHADYNKPLEVQWLCQLHHFEWHSQHKAKEYGK